MPNGTLSASGYGAFEVNVIGVGHGMILAASEDEGKATKAFYFNRMITSDFLIEVIFSGQAQRETFSSWILGYARRRSDPDSVVGSMRVTVPSRNFDKVGIPSMGMEFGDEAAVTIWRSTVTFRGTLDPIEYGSVLTSRFLFPRSDQIVAPYLYPAGVQLSGSEAGEDLAYDLNIQMGEPMVPTVASSLAGVKNALDDLRKLPFGVR